MPEGSASIRVRGARTHNLRNVDLDLPRGRRIVITGPSGSGKSSLAFDTLYAEGQRRFLEASQTETRGLGALLRRPDVDLVEGLPPTLAIAQRSGTPRPRSTLATITEIHDHLRLLWARLGTVHCPRCRAVIQKQTIAAIVRALLSRGEGRKVFLLAPLVQNLPGAHQETIQQIRQSGYLRARVDGVLQEIHDTFRLDADKEHTIEVVVDRLVVRPGLEERFTESITAAAKLGAGRVIVTDLDEGDWRDERFSIAYICPVCGLSVPEPEPQRLNFNSPYGACPTCTGLGQVWRIDPERLAVERDTTLVKVLSRLRDALDQADEEIHESVRVLLNRTEAKNAPVEALLPGLEALARKLNEGDEEDSELRDLLESLSGFAVCPECQGARLNREARCLRLEGKGLHEVAALSVVEALRWFENVPTREAPSETPWGRARATLLEEIRTRLRFLDAVGVGYLTLDRPAPTLSGGELQRARLATQLGGGLRGVCYVLDEPTLGLHPRDTERLLAALHALQNRGNTLIVVEHDEAVIRDAEWLIDIGPGAGPEGGRVLAQGTPAEVLANPESVTGQWLSRRVGGSPARMDDVKKDRAGEPPALRIRGARHHNLKNIDVEIPLGRLVAVTGVSGSGKSSLARDILAHAARRRLGLLAPTPGIHDSIEGLEHLDKVIEVDQKPLGRSSRSCPATYTGLLDDLRQVFAGTRLAKARGYKANRFSYNSRAGWCETCHGQGELWLAGSWLPDLRVPCPACQGRRYNPATLEILYRGKSIAEALAMTVAEARSFFANLPALVRVLDPLAEVGLDYLALGQPSSTLSGGEAQRVKLARELARTATGRTLYLLDEPTSGLHVSDVANLMRLLRRLVGIGNTVVVIEHHLDVIAAADWVLDLGPEAGDAGGNLIYAGPPASLSKCPQSITGRYL